MEDAEAGRLRRIYERLDGNEEGDARREQQVRKRATQIKPLIMDT